MLRLTKEDVLRLLEARPRDRVGLFKEITGLDFETNRLAYHMKKLHIEIENDSDEFTIDVYKKHSNKFNKFYLTPEEEHKDVYERILIMSDIHAPYNHQDIIQFYRDLQALCQFDKVINIGDELDHHAISFHDSDPDLDSAGAELKKGRAVLRELAKTFPHVTVAESNHGSLPYRRQKKHGLPKELILPYKDILFADKDEDGNLIRTGLGEGWTWSHHIEVNTPTGPVLFYHGQDTVDTKRAVREKGMSCVRGHYHSMADIAYIHNGSGLNFGMTVGCSVDEDAMAFAYNKHFNARFIISCGIIINGYPRIIPMPMSKGRYTGINELKKVVGVL